MVKRLTIETFIEKAIAIHGNKYDYSNVIYVNNHTKIRIICPIHGEFLQSPNKHLLGSGCRKCQYDLISDLKRLDTNTFIDNANKIHKSKYNYSKVEYFDSKTKVCIICKEHGDFWQSPNSHLSGKGCSLCSGNRKLNKDAFIIKANLKHGDKYDYSLVEYKNIDNPIKIICPKHGVFEQTPFQHLKKCGCTKCGREIQHSTLIKTTKDFIKKAKLVHGDTYNYNLVEYTGCYNKVKIICPIHGIFEQSADTHLQGAGCPKCSASHGELKIEKYLKFNNIKYESQYKVNLNLRLFSRNKLKVDFYLPDLNVIIEFHGKQHYQYIPFFHRDEDDFAKQIDRDKRLRNYCRQHKINIIEIKYDQIDRIDKILNKKLKIK